MSQPETPHTARSLLKSLDREVIESILKMSTGYVLDFSDRTFADFFEDFDVRISDERFLIEGTSKANRLRAFMKATEPALLADVLQALLERRMVKDPTNLQPTEVERFKGIIGRLSAASQTQLKNAATAAAVETSKKLSSRELMELAVELMDKSVAESREDGKESPVVGAVLVRENGTVDSAARGELREGDHAEFTLIERKNRDTKLDGAVLFVTLEPCAPGARRPPKLSCAERIVNARIKEVWIGVDDPDPTVNGKGISYLKEKGVAVLRFDSDLQLAIAARNADFIRQAEKRAATSLGTPPTSPAVPPTPESKSLLVSFVELADLLAHGPANRAVAARNEHIRKSMEEHIFDVPFGFIAPILRTMLFARDFATKPSSDANSLETDWKFDATGAIATRYSFESTEPRPGRCQIQAFAEIRNRSQEERTARDWRIEWDLLKQIDIGAAQRIESAARAAGEAARRFRI